ncbi:MAG: ABC transporter permease, partial [Wenzhouxiangellaceae bacterium]
MNALASQRLSATSRLIEAQWLNLVRTPDYSLPTLLFPMMFYVFFGLVLIPGGALTLLCTFATFGVMGAALFAFGVGIATERAQGWLRLLRASPAPIGAVILGKASGALLFALIIVVSMSTLAAVFGDVRLTTRFHQANVNDALGS